MHAYYHNSLEFSSVYSDTSRQQSLYESHVDLNRESHLSDVIIGAMASQITSLTIIYSTVEAQIKENIKTPHHCPLWGEVNSPHKWPVTRKKFPFYDVMMMKIHLLPGHGGRMRAACN